MFLHYLFIFSSSTTLLFRKKSTYFTQKSALIVKTTLFCTEMYFTYLEIIFFKCQIVKNVTSMFNFL